MSLTWLLCLVVLLEVVITISSASTGKEIFCRDHGCGCSESSVFCQQRGIASIASGTRLDSAVMILSFTGNQLTNIDPTLFSGLNLLSATLSGNPFHCDCNLQPLVSWISSRQSIIYDISLMTCATPSGLQGRRLTELTSSDLKCNVGSSETPTLPTITSQNLGHGANLLLGIDSATSFSQPPFLQVSGQDSVLASSNPQYLVKVSANNQYHRYLEVGLCESFNELVDRFYKSFTTDDGVNAGTLANPITGNLKQPSVRSRVASLLGVKDADTSDSSDMKFMLVRLWKVKSKIGLKSISPSLSASVNSSLTNLPDKYAFGTSDVLKPYLDFFKTYGTHFVHEIATGDFIYQVFAYRSDKFARLTDICPSKFCWGSVTSSYVYYTTARLNENLYGFVDYHSTVRIASNDVRFSSVVSQIADTSNNVDQSIFVLNQKRNLLLSLNEEVLIGMHLKKYDLQTASPRANEVYTNTLYHQFGKSSKISIPNVISPPQQALINVISLPAHAIPTRDVSVIKNRVNLAGLRLVDANNIETLFIFADLIEADIGEISLPGNNVYILCNHFIAKPNGNQVPQIRLATNAASKPKLNIFCGKFSGTLQVSSAGQTPRTIFEGIELQTRSSSSGLLSSDFVNQYAPRYITQTEMPDLYQTDKSFLSSAFSDGLNFFATSLDLSLTSGTISLDEFKSDYRFAKFLSRSLAPTFINSEYADAMPALESTYSRLLSLTQIDFESSQVTFVPALRANAYDDIIGQMVSLVGDYDIKINFALSQLKQDVLAMQAKNDTSVIQQNLRQVGTFLESQKSALAQKETDMANTYSFLVNEKRNALTKSTNRVAELQIKVKEQNEVIKNAKVELIAGVKRYQAEQIISAVVSSVTAVASLASGFGGFSTQAFAELPKMVKLIQKIEQFMKTLDTINTLYLNTKSIVILSKAIQKDVINISKYDLDPEDINVDNVPTELDWKEFTATVDASLRFYITKVPAAVTFKKESVILAERSMAFIRESDKVRRLQFELLLNSKWEDVYKSQANRLDQISLRLTSLQTTPTQHSLELQWLEMAQVLKGRYMYVLQELHRVFILKDSALQYELLQPHTQISELSLETVRGALIAQQGKSIESLSNPDFRPKIFPETYLINNVPVQNLTGEDGYRHTVSTSSANFTNYVRVRIVSLAATVEGLSNPNLISYIQVNSSGHRFVDRDFQRNPLTFTTVDQTYSHAYYTTTGQPLGSQDQSATSKMRMTPFTDWAIRFPLNVAYNKNAIFSENAVTIRLKFQISAILRPQTGIGRRRFIKNS